MCLVNQMALASEHVHCVSNENLEIVLRPLSMPLVSAADLEDPKRILEDIY